MSATSPQALCFIAVLTARPDRADALEAALKALVPPSRQEPGNLEYALFRLRETPEVFHVRESWRDQAALDAHVATPHFQALAGRMDALLAQPLRLEHMVPVAP
ncbi:MAG: putative quinol monooxygenase [Candidatus Dactylopiibacterium sp.]|nr:putative quinol monooxygenase [Candidatus Dactylopiibacterium sp.]